MDFLKEVQKGVTILENSLKFSHKVKHTPSYGSAIPLLDIYLKNMTILILKDTYTSMFIAALIIIAKICKQPKCPLTDE